MKRQHGGRLDHLKFEWDVLPREIEQSLISRAQAGDHAAKQSLVNQFLAYALQIAKRWVRRMPGHDLEDLMQIAQCGILQAIDKYDPSFGTRLITIVTPSIMWALNRSLPDSTLIRVPYRSDSEGGAEYIKRRWALRPCSLSLPVGESGDGTLYDLVGRPGHEIDDADSENRLESIRRCLNRLDERRRNVILMRMDGLTLEEVAEKFDVTRERIRQIETNAMDRLTRYVVEDLANRRRRAIAKRPLVKRARCEYREAIVAGEIAE